MLGQVLTQHERGLATLPAVPAEPALLYQFWAPASRLQSRRQSTSRRSPGEELLGPQAVSKVSAVFSQLIAAAAGAFLPLCTKLQARPCCPALLAASAPAHPSVNNASPFSAPLRPHPAPVGALAAARPPPLPPPPAAGCSRQPWRPSATASTSTLSWSTCRPSTWALAIQTSTGLRCAPCGSVDVQCWPAVVLHVLKLF